METASLDRSSVHDPFPRIFEDGVRAAWPICLGYLPIGLAFGVLAQKGGLSPFEIGLMSLLVFAGSSQFIAVSMMGAGAGLPAVVMTTFLVNFRHFLMSSALAVHLRGMGKGWISLFAYGVTDESFAMNLTRFQDGNWDWKRALVMNQTANAAWFGSTVLGGLGGTFLPAGAFGMDFALMAMFLCLLVFQLRGVFHAVTALLSAACAVVLALLIAGSGHIVAASLLGATLGLALKKFFSRGKGEERS
ncbi:MAG TPA: AzlC family ABC transporter permease [Syntrophales bacterium]|nr:AzlC family ABC transporter permease [Syntrophales bacterium]HPX12144.1 AzlC family ABC transporter permease [Syntrophales bacterium]HQB31557.1 AzlC family ABC transporter permease [Syntrophales bacterium]HQN77224.1 AzlC family ABC transporter permease [Syntrophales bacterium]HQQ26228.1 AzlC family ABC transporter permease [Syntrophales bacterium]